jgi:hypothetical protein
LCGIPAVSSPEAVKDVLPNWRMTHLFENIFPALMEMGVSQTDLDHIVTENVRRFFAGDAKPHQAGVPRGSPITLLAVSARRLGNGHYW